MSFRRYRNYQPGEFIICYADTSAGGIDYSAAQFLSKTNLDVPVVFHSKAMATQMTPQLKTELDSIYDITKVKPVVCYEDNNGGIFELERLATLNREGKYRMYLQKSRVGTTETTENSTKYGFNVNSSTRPAMLSLLKEAIDTHSLEVYDKPTINEMLSFIVNDKGKPVAEQGAHDDLIMSLAGAWQLYQSENPITMKKSTKPRRKPVNLHI